MNVTTTHILMMKTELHMRYDETRHNYSKIGTEPNKELTKEECETLIDTVYDYFAQNVMVTVGGKEIRVGAECQHNS